MSRLVILIASLFVLSCDQNLKSNAEDRWYTRDQVDFGAVLFSKNCAVCHGEEAEGPVGDWRQRLDDGSFPPPPLNGSAPAWHHPISMLLQVINEGGASFGGMMPAFSDTLGDGDKLAVIAYFQSYWTDEVYYRWELMGGTD